MRTFFGEHAAIMGPLAAAASRVQISLQRPWRPYLTRAPLDGYPHASLYCPLAQVSGDDAGGTAAAG